MTSAICLLTERGEIMKAEKNRSFEPRQTIHRSEAPSLTWADLTDLYEELPSDLCAKSQLVLDLYDDGVCSADVQRELQQHIKSCQICQERLAQLREISSIFEQGREFEVTMTDDQVSASFDRFLSAYGEELNEGHSDEMRPSEQRSTPVLTVEGPPLRVSPRTRVQAGLGLLFAAALLFAYGPALIEAPIDEASYPTAELSGGVSAKAMKSTLKELPLEHLLEKDRVDKSASPIMISDIKSLTHSENADVALYTVLQGEVEHSVEMTKNKLTAQQLRSLKQRLTRSTIKRPVSLTTHRSQRDFELAKPVSFQAYITSQDELHILEYINADQHMQWAVNGSPSVITVLENLASIHVSASLSNR